MRTAFARKGLKVLYELLPIVTRRIVQIAVPADVTLYLIAVGPCKGAMSSKVVSRPPPVLAMSVTVVGLASSF